MSEGPRVLFVADGGPAVGGGHVMRCLTLARALAETGADCAFVATPSTAGLLSVFGSDVARVNAASGELEALIDAAHAATFEAVVFDHYGLGHAEHRALARGRPAMVIDDRANRPLACDLLLDTGPTRRPEDYDGRVPATARLLLGPAYAPVRPQFAALRGQALARRDALPVRRVLVSLGLTDVGELTSRALDRVRARLGEVRIDVVLGGDAPSLAGLQRLARRDPRLALHVDVQDMALLTAEADIAVGAGGSSVWERCTLALPSLALILAENQRPAATALGQLGAALVVDAKAPDFDAAVDRALIRLTNDADLRTGIAARSAELCDGLGAGRAAAAFLETIAACDTTS